MEATARAHRAPRATSTQNARASSKPSIRPSGLGLARVRSKNARSRPLQVQKCAWAAPQSNPSGSNPSITPSSGGNAFLRRAPTRVSASLAPMCLKRSFFLQVIYLMVGDAIRCEFRHVARPLVEALIELGDDVNHPRFWQERSRRLLDHPREFAYEQWCAGGLGRRPA